jgi:hypothetical protein
MNAAVDDLSEPLKGSYVPTHINVKMQNNIQMKQILTSTNGYAKPG